MEIKCHLHYISSRLQGNISMFPVNTEFHALGVTGSVGGHTVSHTDRHPQLRARVPEDPYNYMSLTFFQEVSFFLGLFTEIIVQFLLQVHMSP